jgi:small subunit ribosomal protein S20
MANIKSAKKRARQSEKRRAINLARKSSVKTAVKKVIVAVEAGDMDMQELLRKAEAKLARAKGKGLIHPKAAARKISRLAKRVAAAKKK